MRSVKIAGLAVAAAGTLVSSSSVHAAPVLAARCNIDSLDPGQAQARLEWARRCGTLVNVVSPTTPRAPASTFLTGGTSANGIALREFVETIDFWGMNSYSGDLASVNTIFVQNQFRPGVVTASTAEGGFQKWMQPVVLPRPNYPTFGNNADINFSTQLFPNPNPAAGDCRLYLDQNATQPADTSLSGFFVNGYCTSSCYTPEQTVSFAGGSEKIVDALAALRSGVVTLEPGSTLDKLAFKTDEVASYTRELRDSTHVIYELRTASGGELRVTDKHPIIEGSGRVVEAASLRAGDTLIKADGSRDPIVSVTKTVHFGKVYNLKPASTERVANILVAQGYLVGSSRYQNEDVDYINRIILGRGVPADVIPQ